MSSAEWSKMNLMSIVFLISCVELQNSATVPEGSNCPSPQYIEYGSTGVIECSFREGFFGVIWYNSTDVFHKEAILILENSVKSGVGFLSGSFDVYPNGSLIINTASIVHEGTYTVIQLETPTTKTSVHFVSVFVIAKTFSRLPEIEKCDNKSEICFQVLDPNAELSCSIRDSRSEIPLIWLIRTRHGNRYIPFQSSIRNKTQTFFTTQSTTTDCFSQFFLSVLFLCKAEDERGLLDRNESIVLVQKNDKSLLNVEPVAMHSEINSRLELTCGNSQLLHISWQVMKQPGSNFDNILYAIFIGENYTHTEDYEYKLGSDGSLVVDDISVRHEGIYRCISGVGNGIENDVLIYDLTVFVAPLPAHLTVDGCHNHQYCVLDGYSEGNLTCILKFVRPPVQLEFKQLFAQHSESINFYNKTLSIVDNGETFDILMTSNYRFNGDGNSKLTITCKVADEMIPQLRLSTNFDIWFVHDTVPSMEGRSPFNERFKWIMAALIVTSTFLLILLLLFVTAFTRVFSRIRLANNSREFSEQAIPLVRTRDLDTMKKEFKTQLKAKYQDMYEAVQPMPYIKDRLFCVNNVFVEGGIEYLVATEKMGRKEVWETLDTYHNILTDKRVESTRRILEGEPGYGKSILSLQLAYDWCNEVQTSSLKNIDLFILLRLRHFRDDQSIYAAIKRFLLPKDTRLSESNIEYIVGNSSVVMVLDAYDEYPDRGVEKYCVISDIIARNSCQRLDVILTTRSSCLPKELPAMAKRIKLTGFDEQAQNLYIKKAVVKNNTKAAKNIKRKLKENPVLANLCQVPLIFVMFAHMSHESKEFKNVNSVTSFFRYMISCFHSHMKNKVKGRDDVQYNVAFETEHKQLNKLAFEGLSGKVKQMSWRKDYVRDYLGHEFYDQYVRVGILVEEEVLEISDDPKSPISEHIQYQTEVRFYHKLFCEWYAAHQFSEYVSNDSVNIIWDHVDDSVHSSCEDVDWDHEQVVHHQETNDYVVDLSLSDVQYVYRFACGLNKITAERIIAFLKKKDDADKFIILCIIEKGGKLDNVLQGVRDLCAKPINIHDDDSLLLQKSTIQILEVASRHKISIARLWLDDSIRRVDASSGRIYLKSDFFIPVLSTLKQLSIRDTGGEIDLEELRDIFTYSSKCLDLQELRFWYCLLPWRIQDESLSVLKARDISVIWLRGESVYVLDRQSGEWKNNISNAVMTHEEYSRAVGKIASLRR